MKRKLLLIRGISSSGKTTLAENLVGELFSQGKRVYHIEADHYWIDLEDQYRWNPKYLGLAHQWCLASVVRLFEILDFETVIVANTFTTVKEMQPYIDYAAAAGISVEILEPDTPWKFDAQECFMRNTHKVPLEVIQKQLDRWETI